MSYRKKRIKNENIQNFKFYLYKYNSKESCQCELDWTKFPMFFIKAFLEVELFQGDNPPKNPQNLRFPHLQSIPKSFRVSLPIPRMSQSPKTNNSLLMLIVIKVFIIKLLSHYGQLGQNISKNSQKVFVSGFDTFCYQQQGF